MKILPTYNFIRNIKPIEHNFIDFNMNNYPNIHKIEQTESKFVIPKQESAAILSFQENRMNNNQPSIISFNPVQMKTPEIISTIYDKNQYNNSIHRNKFEGNQNILKPMHKSPNHYNFSGTKARLQNYKSRFGPTVNNNTNELNLSKINILDDIKNDLSLLEVKPIEELSSPRIENTTSKKRSIISLKYPYSKISENKISPPNINKTMNKNNYNDYNFNNISGLDNSLDIHNSAYIHNNQDIFYNLNNSSEEKVNNALDSNLSNIMNKLTNKYLNNNSINIDFHNENINKNKNKDIINTNEFLNNSTNNKKENSFKNNEYNINNNYFIINNNEYNFNNNQQYNININWLNDNNNDFNKKNNNEINNYNYQEMNNKEYNINNNDYDINKNNEYNFINDFNNINEYNEQNKIDFNIDLINSQNNDINNEKEEIVPDSKFDLSEFIEIGEVGKGTEGTIFSVKWKKNNKQYALKKSIIRSLENVKKRQEEIIMLKNFRKNTGSDGVIQIYGDLCITKDEYYDFYEIMELAEVDWEQEIINRGQIHLYYEEDELFEIMRQIVKTCCLLQKNHITHRDIKPQNIMIVKGKFKICDFGNARILKREGMVVQRIRGSEMYMSPIMFRGYHSNLSQVKHHTFKSDVFSLGMCFLLAAALSYNPLNKIREIYDNNVIRKIINNYLGNRYSQKIYNIIFSMLQIEEYFRPDFVQLEALFTD